MRKILVIFLCLIMLSCLFGCQQSESPAQIIATTQPVYDFTVAICSGTGIAVSKLITENVSCLHDYTLQVNQMRSIESADVVVLSGAGMESFLDDALLNAKEIIDSSAGIDLICNEDNHHHKEHTHEVDSHIWLSPSNAIIMAENIYHSLLRIYPDHKDIFKQNHLELQKHLQDLSSYAEDQLNHLSTRDIITFHNGFSYMANAFHLNIIHAIEEEAGSEASAAQLITLTQIVTNHNLNSIFTECNGSTSAAQIIAAETGAKIYALDMCMAERNYIEAMKYNIDTLKEALE